MLEFWTVAHRIESGIRRDFASPELCTPIRCYHQNGLVEGLKSASLIMQAKRRLALFALAALRLCQGLGKNASNIVHHFRRRRAKTKGLLRVLGCRLIIAEHDPG